MLIYSTLDFVYVPRLFYTDLKFINFPMHNPPDCIVLQSDKTGKKLEFAMNSKNKSRVCYNNSEFSVWIYKENSVVEEFVRAKKERYYVRSKN